jgi:SOS-response transcriptional repressor LexA
MRINIRDLEKETDLAKILKDENLRGYKVMDILAIGSDWKVKFTNGVEVTTTQPHYFKTEKAKKTDPTIRESSEQTYPVFDVIGRVADETNLTRKSVLQIYKGLSDSQKSLLFKNPEGWTGHFLAQIKGALCDHVAERIVFSANPEAETSYDENELFKDIVIIPQRELIAAGPRGLYDKVQIDSEVERDFVRKSVMADEDHVVVYFKFPPSFKIRLPKIIGNYNPDWAIVRRDNEGQLTLQLVRETKGGLNLEELQFPQEKRKIRCAQRHFATLGISYRVVTGNTPRWWEDDPDLNHQLDLVVTESRMAKLSLVPPADREHWVNCIPVISDLKIAAGYWSDEQALDIEDPAWAEEWMALPESVKVEKGMFVAPIQGLSMQPLVNDGDWCLFRPAQAGSRNGKRVLVWHAGTADSETGNAFTFKEYHSEKASDGDSWAHTKITLHPLNKDFDPIVLTPEEESSVRVIAEFVQVIEQKATSPKTKTKADISVDQESGENEDDLDDSEEIRNEKASIKPVSITQIEDYKIICAIRSAMVSGGARSRAELIKDVATELGYARTGQKITEVIDNKIKTAVGRKILINEGGLISIYARSIDGYDRETIREQFLKSLSRSWIEREKAIRDFARWMGFSRTGEAIESMAKSLIMGLLMTKNIESSGSMIRRL